MYGLLQFRPDTVYRMNVNYAGSDEVMSQIDTFPGGGDLGRMPPTLVLDADRDVLRASGEALVAELGAAGVDVRHQIVGGTTHGFLDRPRRAAFERAIDALDAFA
ncbi:alpha/beta hydrolase [Curtobacterium sp. ISL-83]|uniref:alpha/beta hydrolase n=1 Tax=Curtobacterium sp. ISL-83 TaxID=2819145 RepID=UPI001BE6F855|nr:alpha/beta hydrolase fold domain-containing protein [Curtobacterium sp. ISL-83]MBT2502328.1 alpha/beta hydrolase fold domain-containing protein [Curtobacterium sp. ISL-83]